MNLARLILTLSIAAAAHLLQAQQPPTPAPPGATAPVKLPTFDVISVKVNNSGSRDISMGSTPDGLHATNIPAQLILKQAFAFAVNDDRIFGAPAWAQTTRFDIDAKVSGPDVAAFKALTNGQLRPMIVQILTARFQFAYHVETRVLPKYALVVAKGGPKFQPSQPGNDPDHPKRSSMQVHDGMVTGQGVPLEPLIHFLSDRVGRPIEDKTGLIGTYDFTLQLGDEGHDRSAPGPDPNSAADPTGPSIFTALQEQLGLRLDAEKGPVQVLVVDHIEMPAQN